MYQSIFAKEEFAERRNRVFDAIGNQAVALIQGGPAEFSHNLFRQTNHFFYLCGVEVPHAYLFLDGRERISTLFLPHQSAKNANQVGERLSPEKAGQGLQLTGLDEIAGIEDLSTRLQGVTLLYTPFCPAEGFAMSWDTLAHGSQEAWSDPWDGKTGRTSHFLGLLKERRPAMEIRNLDALLNDLRLIKSPREVELLHRAGRLSALGVTEAMRSTKPGVTEFQLDAILRYVYLANGSLDAGYRAIIAGGKNAWYGHYNANNATLEDGDLILVDCAPDYHYYTSDIGRMWPVNGKYTDAQRELYGFIVEYHKVFLKLLRPGVSAEQITDEASREMARYVDKTQFSKPIYENAARRALVFPHHMSHPVGMAVHDVGHYRGHIIKPGVAFALDPQMQVPEERLYIRVEDTVVFTETGIINFTGVAPLELDDVEQVMTESSMLEAYPGESG